MPPQVISSHAQIKKISIGVESTSPSSYFETLLGHSPAESTISQSETNRILTRAGLVGTNFALLTRIWTAERWEDPIYSPQWFGKAQPWGTKFAPRLGSASAHDPMEEVP